jgi:zinc transporter ZupT
LGSGTATGLGTIPLFLSSRSMALAASLGYARWQAAADCHPDRAGRAHRGPCRRGGDRGGADPPALGLAFAAGAMLFVISREIIPRRTTRGRGDLVTATLLLGLAMMMVLDVVLS